MYFNLPHTIIIGRLQSVSNIKKNFTIITWVAPFSLNLTNADPNIVYCVEVYNITCGRSLLISECDVMETSYTNDVLLPGYIYEYTVTPRSNVEGATNGTSLTVIGTCIITVTMLYSNNSFTSTQISEEFLMLNLSSGHNFTILNDTENRSDVMVTFHLDSHGTQVLIDLSY